MDARQILISLHHKYNGDWEKIFDFIKNKNKFSDDDLDLTDIDNLITILDSNYPDELKKQYRPPFVITKEQANPTTYEITFKVKVSAFNEMDALDKGIDRVVSGNCEYEIK